LCQKAKLQNTNKKTEKSINGSALPNQEKVQKYAEEEKQLFEELHHGMV